MFFVGAGQRCGAAPCDQSHEAPYVRQRSFLLQVDVYSLGVIMCQLFAGVTPYAGMSMPAVLFAVVHQVLTA